MVAPSPETGASNVQRPKRSGRRARCFCGREGNGAHWAGTFDKRRGLRAAFVEACAQIALRKRERAGAAADHCPPKGKATARGPAKSARRYGKTSAPRRETGASGHLRTGSRRRAPGNATGALSCLRGPAKSARRYGKISAPRRETGASGHLRTGSRRRAPGNAKARSPVCEKRESPFPAKGRSANNSAPKRLSRWARCLNGLRFGEYGREELPQIVEQFLFA